MSRLDSAIRRLAAQRACLDLATTLVAATPGPVLELGLGNGRTFDHLRTRLPDREIFVFDRQVAAHPECIPDAAHLVLGDFYATIPEASARFTATVALIHADFGSGDTRRDSALAAFLGPELARMVAAGGVVVTDQPIEEARFRPIPLPEDVPQGRYFMYRSI